MVSILPLTKLKWHAGNGVSRVLCDIPREYNNFSINYIGCDSCVCVCVGVSTVMFLSVSRTR